MNNSKLIELDKLDVLRKMAKSLTDNDIPAQFEEPSEENGGRLYVLMDDFGINSEKKAAQFYFEDNSVNSEGMLYLTSLIILDDEIPSEMVEIIGYAMSILNGRIPCGAFVLTMDSSAMAYKMVTPISDTLTYDMLYTQLNIVMTNSMFVADTYYDVLEGVKNGELNINDVVSVIEG